MTDLKATARALLEALRTAGDVEAADEWLSRLDHSGWTVSPSVVHDMSQAVSRAVQRSTAPVHAGEEDDRATPLEMFRAFLDPIASWREMATSLSGLGAVRSFGECQEHVRSLFVECLGYSPKAFDATGRLRSTGTFPRLVGVAAFEGFQVSIAEVSSEFPYSTPYQPILSLFPYGLCIVVNVERKFVRFVYGSGQGQRREPHYRTFLGSIRGRDANDNLAVWIRRLSLMKPVFGDDDLAVSRRVEDALSVSPRQLAEAWESIDLDAPHQDLPGPLWSDLPHAEAVAFVQKDSTDRLHWGLEAVLRERFPMAVGFGSGKLSCHGYRLEATNASREASGVDLTLELGLGGALEVDGAVYLGKEGWYDAEAQEVRFDLPCFLQLPEGDGCFLRAAERWLYSPSEGEPGRNEAWLATGSEAELDSEDGDDELEEPDEPDELEPWAGEALAHGPFAAINQEGEDSAVGLAQGYGLTPVLEACVAVRLAALSRSLRRVPRDRFDGLPSVLRTLALFSDARGRFELASNRVLDSVLTVSQEPLGSFARVVRRSSSAALPPAWACPDSSAARPGAWVPVRGARLHPSGELAVPLRGDAGHRLRVSTLTALEVNPRVGDRDVVDGRHWIAEGLEHWSDLRVGQLVDQGTLLRPGATTTHERIWIEIRGEVDRTEDVSSPAASVIVDEKRLKEITCQNALRRSRLLEIPLLLGRAEPSLRIEPGQWVTGGTTWLEVPRELWGAPTKGTVHWAAELVALLAERDVPDCGFQIRVPASWSGVVTEADLRVVRGRFGEPVAWRATLTVASPPVYAAVLLPNGSVVPIQTSATEDMPFEPETGRTPGILFRGNVTPASGAQTRRCVDGRSGETLDVIRQDSLVRWLPATVGSGTTMEGSRLLDNALVPKASQERPTDMSRLWLRLAHPALALGLEVAEERGRERVRSWEPALGAVLENLDLAGARGIVNWRCTVSKSRVAARGALDKTRRASPRSGASDSRVGGFSWSCPCGTLVGLAQIDKVCRTCKGTVEETAATVLVWACGCGENVSLSRNRKRCSQCRERPSLRGVPTAAAPFTRRALPFEILHPWWFREIATLLGLQREELLQRLGTHGPAPLARLIRRVLAADGPLDAAAVARLEGLEDRQRRSELGVGLHRLRALLHRCDSWILDHFAVVPPRFLLTGLFPGAPRLVHSGLMEKYRHLRLALEQAKVHQSSVLAGVRTEAQLAVQEAVNALYGDLDAGHDSVDSLAGLVARLWPLSAANSSRSAELVASSDPGCGAVPGQPGEESGLRSPKTFVGNPANEPDWHRAFARSKLSTDLLLPLVGIIAGVRSEAIEDRIRGSVRDARSLPVERFSLRLVSALLCSLQHPSGRPDVLHDLLVRQLPLALPTVSVDASSEIEKRLEGAFFGSDDETGMVTAALVFALSNWWAREPSAECPLGWEFDSEVERSTPWRRALPPLHSKAWLSWTGAGGLLSPLEWLLHGGARSPVLKTALGFPHALDVEWRHQAEDRLAQRAAESERPWASAEPLTPIRTAIAEAESQVAVPRSTLDEVVAGRSDAVRQPEIRLLRVGLRDWLSVGP